MRWGVPLGTSTGIIMVEKWGDVSASPEEGTTNGGVHGHESRRRASAVEEYINDEVRRDGGRLPRGLGGDMARFVTAAIS